MTWSWTEIASGISLLVLLLAGGAGCQASGGDAGGVEIIPDPADAMFDPARVLEVDIEMDAAHWEELLQQDRDWDELLAGDCLGAPWPNPFTYFPATVSVDGVTRHEVGVRKKGLGGSLSDEKPALKIKLDEYIEDQRLSGLRRMTLNNSLQDPSYVKQCIGYQLYGAAGIPTPRCNFAHVQVNGEDLGLYVHVEPIKKDFVGRHFGDDGGNLYEATISDFREGWTGTFELETNESSGDRSDIDAVTEALEADDGQLLAAVEPLVDVDAFITFWTLETLVGHWDGYAGNVNNYYLYHDPDSDQFYFLPWGIDSILDVEEPVDPLVMANGLLAHRLYLLPETRDRYLERLSRLLDDLWDVGTILAEIDRMELLVSPVTDSAGEGDHAQYVEAVRQFVTTRADVIQSQLQEGPPEWDEPLLEPPCED